MDSPKSRQHKEKKVSYRRREHKNKKFYNSKAWKDTREAYLRHYRNTLLNEVVRGKYKGQDLSMHQVSYLLSIATPDFLPCESCLRLYIQGAYDEVDIGKELDHIEPVNPSNALETQEVTFGQSGIRKTLYGDPFDFNNLQLLCKRHHAKKSQRER